MKQTDKGENDKLFIILYILQFSMLKHESLVRDQPENFKKRLFRVFHHVIHQYSVPKTLYLIFIILETFQMLLYCLHPKYAEIWETPSIYYLQKVLSFIDLSGLWEVGGLIMTMVWSIIIFVLSGVTIGVILWEIKGDKGQGAQKSQQTKIKFLQYVGLIIRTILVIPVTTCTIYTMANLTNSQQPQFIKIIALLLAILASTLYFICFVIFLILFIDSSPFSRLPFATALNYNQSKKAILKILMGIFGGIATNSIDPKVVLMFQFIFFLALVYLCYLNLSSPSLLDLLVDKISKHSIVILIWVSLVVIIQSWITPANNLSLIFVGSGCLMVNWVWKWARDFREENIIFQNFRNLTSKADILSYVYYMCQYVRDLRKDSINLIKIEGMLSEHIFQCKKSIDNCFCQQLKKKITEYHYDGDRNEGKLETKDWYEYIKYNLTVASENNSECEYYLLLGNIQKQMMRNNFRSYKNLQLLKIKKQPLRCQFLCYHQKRIIQAQLVEQDVRKNEKKGVNVNNFFRYALDVKKLQELVLQSSIEHLNFWTGLKTRTTFNNNSVIQDGNRLEICIEQIKSTFDRIMLSHRNSLIALIIYSNYFKYILNDSKPLDSFKQQVIQIKKKIMKEPKITGEIEKQKYSDNANTGVIIISGQRSDIGTIKYCTSKITNILKYPTHELIGLNVNILMPKFIGNMHNQVLYNYLEMAQSQFDFVQRLAPMIDKDSFLVMGRILTKPFPSLLNGLQMVGIFQRIKQKHIKHPNQPYRYILYRSDSGKVQAVSDTFYQEYGFRVVKIDQYSQVSSELYFNSLFQGVNETQIKANENGFSVEIQSCHSSKRVQAVIYLRHQINFFGVKLKLLSIFRKEEPNYNMMAFDEQLKFNATITKDEVKKTQKYNLNDELGKKQKYNDDKKRQFNIIDPKVKKPLRLRIIHIVLFIFQFLAIGLCSFQLYLNLKRLTIVKQSLSHLQTNSDSIVYLNNVGFYARLTQLAAKYPQISNDFDYFKKNLTIVSSNLQQNQFWLVNKKVNQQDHNTPQTWKLNELGQIYSSYKSTSLSIFDLVTSASSFNSAQPSDLNFNDVLTDPLNDPSNLLFRNLFHIRYSTIFSLRQTKQTQTQALTKQYQTITQNYTNYVRYHIIVTSLLIAVFFFALLWFVWKILDNIFDIVSILAFLTPTQIEKQIQKCKDFLQTCFIDEYEVKILNLSGENMNKMDSFKASNKFVKMKQNNNSFRKSFDVSAIKEMGLDENDDVQNQIDVLGMEKPYDYEKPQSLRSIKINMNGNLPENTEEKMPLKDEQGYVQSFERAENEQKCCMNLSKRNIFIVFFLMFTIIFLYFLLICQYSLSVAHHTNLQIQMKANMNLNMRLLSSVQYYSLESGVDNSEFDGKSTISTQLSGLVEWLYESQRIMYGGSQEDSDQELGEIIRQLNMKSLCQNEFGQLVNIPVDHYSIEQCINLDQSVLELGLRASTVAFIQTCRKVSNLNSAQQLIQSQQFQKYMSLAKYVLNSIQLAINRAVEDMLGDNTQEVGIFVTAFISFMIAFNITILIVNYRTVNWLIQTILGTNRIISLIPNRIFQKNQKLSDSYQIKLTCLYD